MIVVIHYLFGRYARPIRKKTTRRGTRPQRWYERYVACFDHAVCFLDFVGVRKACFECSVCMREARECAYAEWRNDRNGSAGPQGHPT